MSSDRESIEQHTQPRVIIFDHTAVMSGGEIAMANVVDSIPGCTMEVWLGEHGPLERLLASHGTVPTIIEIPQTVRDFSRNNFGFNITTAKQLRLTLSYAKQLRSHISIAKPDVVVANSLKAFWILVLATFPRRQRLRNTLHLRDRLTADAMSPLGALATKYAAALWADAIIANSANTMTTVPRLRRNQRRDVIPSPILPPTPEQFSTRPLESDVLRVGMLGRLTPWKGQLLAIRAFTDAFDTGRATLDIVGGALFGEVDYEREIIAAIETSGRQHEIRLRGHAKNIHEWTTRWDCMVHASTTAEPFGQVVVQGMSAGLVVIAPNEGGPAETITHKLDGLLFNARDLRSLTSTLKWVADNKDKTTQIGERAKLTAARYVPAVVGQAMSTALRDQ